MMTTFVLFSLQSATTQRSVMIRSPTLDVKCLLLLLLFTLFQESADHAALRHA